MLWAARRAGRPVKWTCTRSEAHVSDDDARDNIVDAALALDKDGKFLGVRIRSFGNLGAFVSFRGAMPPVVNIGTVCGVYTTPAAHVAISGMLTNTHCTSPYRGAGRPEASYMIERLIDIAADEMKIDPAELRRRNTIPPDRMPYKTPLTFTYDSGRFEENMDRAMKLGDWTGFEARRKEAAKRGKLRGIGLSNTIEQAADPTIETAEIRFDPLGGMTFVSGSISHGQGHATIQTQILVDRRSRGVRHGHRRLALHYHERRRHRHGGRQGDRQGQEAHRPHAGGIGGRHRVQGRPLHHRGHRPESRHPRRGQGRI
jgi:carbon-monoxide dehydrogenase large subunit